MNKKLKYILIFILVSLLFVIRAFENELFYDPLIEYFHNDYLYAKMPEVNIWKLVVSTLYRYTLNSLITIGVIRVVFGKKRFVKFASFFLMVAFMLLIVVFVFLVRSEFEAGYLFPFYVRRFLIHPLFLFLLLATFYYQKLNKNT
jgi:exosortase F-associated protein